MLDGKRLEHRQLFVCIALIFNGTAHRNILIPICPILRDTLCESLNALGQKEKVAVCPLLDHFPAIAAPSIGFFNEKVGRKAEIYKSGFHFIAALFELCYRLVKVLCLDNHARIDTTFGIALMYVAMQAAFAAFFTSVPRIPHWHSFTLLSFISLICIFSGF